jgi:hypothetical protein
LFLFDEYRVSFRRKKKEDAVAPAKKEVAETKAAPKKAAAAAAVEEKVRCHLVALHYTRFIICLTSYLFIVFLIPACTKASSTTETTNIG